MQFVETKLDAELGCLSKPDGSAKFSISMYNYVKKILKHT